MAETWCNEIINKIFNMGKGKVINQKESKKSQKNKEKNKPSKIKKDKKE